MGSDGFFACSKKGRYRANIVEDAPEGGEGFLQRKPRYCRGIAELSRIGVPGCRGITTRTGAEKCSPGVQNRHFGSNNVRYHIESGDAGEACVLYNKERVSAVEPSLRAAVFQRLHTPMMVNTHEDIIQNSEF